MKMPKYLTKLLTYNNKNQIDYLHWDMIYKINKKYKEILSFDSPEPYLNGIIDKIKYNKNSSESRFHIRYVLDVYESNLDGGNKAYDLKVNIEHIVPQSPHHHWGLKISKLKKDDDILYKDYNQLGNLLILEKGYNKDASNYLLDSKMAKMKGKNIKIASINSIFIKNQV